MSPDLVQCKSQCSDRDLCLESVKQLKRAMTVCILWYVFSFHIQFCPCPWILQARAHVLPVSRMWAVGLGFEGQAFPCGGQVWRSCRQSFLCSGKDALLPARCLLEASAAVSGGESHSLALSHWMILPISGIRVLENASPGMLAGIQVRESAPVLGHFTQDHTE